MRTFFAGILLLLTWLPAPAQSRALDSSICVSIARFDTTHTQKFSALYSAAVAGGLYTRLDTISYTHAFIDATIVVSEEDTFLSIKEWYFSGPDSMPYLVFVDNSDISGDDYFNLPFAKLRRDYKRLQPVQSLAYDRVQIYTHGCIQPRWGKARKRVREKLQSMYRIQVSVDRSASAPKVSMQTPAKHPLFFVKRQGGKF